CRALDALLASRLDRAGEAIRNVEGKFSSAGSAIARDDAIVPPLHHARPELVAELVPVDQEQRRSQALRFQCEQGERRLEGCVGHPGWQPSQLQDPVGLVMYDFSPIVPGYFCAHFSVLLAL